MIYASIDSKAAFNSLLGVVGLATVRLSGLCHW